MSEPMTPPDTAREEGLKLALESIDDLLTEEIKVRFGTDSSKTEAEVAGKSQVYSLLNAPRNIARNALNAHGALSSPARTGVEREAVARLVDPGAWRRYDLDRPEYELTPGDRSLAGSLAKAAAILALLQQTKEPS